MTLRVILIEEEPEQDISYVPVNEVEDGPDPEMPDEFLIQNDLDELDETTSALESISLHIACEGMDLSTARELDKIDPTFIRRNGGSTSFTSRPSLEGLVDAANTVKDKSLAIIKRLRDFVVKFYRNMVNWITSKFAQPESQDIKQEVEQFLAERRNRDAINYISSLPDDPDEAAAEVARFMDGETQAFTSNFVDQIQSLTKNIETVESMIHENPVRYRLAKGIITVEELFKEESDSAIRGVLKKAASAADQALKARTTEQFMQALQNVEAASEEINEFEKNTVISTEPSSEQGDDRGVPFNKLYDNIRTVSEAMKRVDTKHLLQELSGSVEEIIRLSESAHFDDILEMMPEELSGEQQHAYATKIASLYRGIAVLGKKVLLIWQTRVNSLATINSIGDKLLEFVDSFEKAVVASSGSLSDEQKAQLAKGLAGKGLKIVF
jgi:chemotaxis regulatin CheY-phosphate phosphatase CheZ